MNIRDHTVKIDVSLQNMVAGTIRQQSVVLARK